jgi:hypothetical protein
MALGGFSFFAEGGKQIANQTKPSIVFAHGSWVVPVVLVGQSYGRAIITKAGNDPKVSALVYIAAFALDDGDSCASIEKALPQAYKVFKPDSNGNWWIDQEHFAADVPPAVSHFMAHSQVPISIDSFTHKVTSPAWKTKPTWYMVANADRSINPRSA